MIYQSRNGCLFYYDRLLYRWCVADSTMLFLLGFEAITTYENSVSDSLTIADSVYIKSINKTVQFEYFDIYDDIHEYLSEFSCITDDGEILVSNINGLKLFINDLTGTDNDKTIPIIFKNDVNNKAIDLNGDMFRFTSSNRSFYNLQAQKIHDIFSDANFTIPDDTEANYYQQERISNGNIFKLLDYKSMYSYALGVLYGCRCLGYNNDLIWHIRPSVWYNGSYTNLVNTAWWTFRFYHLSGIFNTDSEKESEREQAEIDEIRYRSIVPNRLWNFDEIADEVRFKSPSKELLRLSISHGSTLIEFYHSDTEDECYAYDSDTDSWRWSTLNLDNEDDGLVDLDDDIIRKYFAGNKINILKGHKDYFPEEKPYFIHTCDIGWVNIDFTSAELTDSITEFDTSKLKTAVDKITYKTVSCYELQLSPTDSIYFLDYDESTNTFKEILSDSAFSEKYKLSSYLPESLTEILVYDLSNPVKIYKTGDTIFDYDNKDENDVTLNEYLDNTGYSLTPSSLVDLYTSVDGELLIKSYRNYTDGGTAYFWSDRSTGWETDIEDIYTKVEATNNLYRGSVVEIENTLQFNRYESSDEIYIFNDGSSDYISSGFDLDFVDINELHDQLGITQYACQIIEKDSEGNYLKDKDGNFLVWKDSVTKTATPYWNGYAKEWQSKIPELQSALMYDAESKSLKSVYEIVEDRLVIDEDGNIITYDDIYSSTQDPEGTARSQI